MVTLKEAEGTSYNPTGKFLVVVADSDGVSSKELGQQIYAELWKKHFIIDNTILIAVRDNYVSINGNYYTDGLRKDTLDLYTGFQNERGSGGEVTDVCLLDRWRLHDGTFINNLNLYPHKIRESFNGCQIRAATFDVPPYIILTGNSKDSDDNVVYKLGGLAGQNLRLEMKKMSATVVFLKPSAKFSLEDGVYAAGSLANREFDVVIGIFPLIPVFLASTFQPTIPYEYTALKCFVSCPQPVARMEKFMHTYQIPVCVPSVIYIGVGFS